MITSLACIVEGHGEVRAVPPLLQRIAAEVRPGIVLRTPDPLRRRRGSLVKANEFERDIEFMARKAGLGGGLLILLDADDDCPAQLGPDLLERARRVRSDLPVSVVLAKMEFEAWFLAAAHSLRGVCGLSRDLEAPPAPESIRAAKAWLSQRMPSPYVETIHQARMARSMDLQSARLAASFDKCYRDISAMIVQA